MKRTWLPIVVLVAVAAAALWMTRTGSDEVDEAPPIVEPEVVGEEPSGFPTTIARAQESHIVKAGQASITPDMVGSPEEMERYSSLRGEAPDTFHYYSLANSWGGCCAQEIMGKGRSPEIMPLALGLTVIVSSMRDATQNPDAYEWGDLEALQRDLIRALRERPQSSPTMLNGLDMIELTLDERNAARSR